MEPAAGGTERFRGSVDPDFRDPHGAAETKERNRGL
jgi:hypothetical protein